MATIRTLAMDAVQKARSGHPGTPMALAPVAYVLWQRFLRYDPADPIWPDHHRFVLSNGQVSLYALLHLSGVKAVDTTYESLGRLAVELLDIERFRQLCCKCPGHPEYRWTSGVEVTTGCTRSAPRRRSRCCRTKFGFTRDRLDGERAAGARGGLKCASRSPPTTPASL